MRNSCCLFDFSDIFTYRCRVYGRAHFCKNSVSIKKLKIDFLTQHTLFVFLLCCSQPLLPHVGLSRIGLENSKKHHWPIISALFLIMALTTVITIDHFTVAWPFEWKWGWRWPYFDWSPSVFHMLTMLFSRLLVVIYIGKAVISLSKQGSPASHSNARQPFVQFYSLTEITSTKLHAASFMNQNRW